MLEQKRDTIRSIATALAMGIMLFMLSSFSNKSFRQNNTPSQYVLRAESHDARAIINDDVQIPSVQKSILPLHSNLFGNNCKAYAESKSINRSYTLLLKTQLTIKPLIRCRFYYLLFSNDAEDLPEISKTLFIHKLD